MQQFITHIRHIAGKNNHAADYLSRTFDETEVNCMMAMMEEEFLLMNSDSVHTSASEAIELSFNALHSSDMKIANDYELSPEQESK